MRPTSLFALAALSAALAAPTLATADTYTLAHFSGAVFGGNANAQAPFTGAGIHQGMAIAGTFLIDDTSDKSGAFNNLSFSTYADAAQITGATDFSLALGNFLFTGADDPAGGAIQYHNSHFNGFAYSSDFDYLNVGYNFTISGGTFSIIQRDTFQQFVGGFINIGDNNVTGKTPFTPPPPIGTGGGGVPEPASWALMITGFGLAGAVLRRRRRSALTA